MKKRPPPASPAPLAQTINVNAAGGPVNVAGRDAFQQVESHDEPAAANKSWLQRFAKWLGDAVSTGAGQAIATAIGAGVIAVAVLVMAWLKGHLF